MADPFTLAVIGIGMSAASGGVGAFGAIQGGKAQKAMYEYQAGVAQINKQIAEQNARYETAAGEIQAQNSGMKSRFELGRIKSAQSASNLDINTGSAADVRSGIQDVAKYDQALIRSNAARKRYGYEVQGTQQEAQANLYGMAGKQSETAGYISAVSSLLGGGTQVADKWMKASQLGIF